METALKTRTSSIVLHAGEVEVTRGGVSLETTVGHGVCVCIVSERTTTCGMCHFELPEAPNGSIEDTRYGDAALFHLVKQMFSEAPGEKYVAAIIGGALIDGQHEAAEENIKQAHEYLELHEIPIVLNEERGMLKRNIAFQAADGGVLVTTV